MAREIAHTHGAMAITNTASPANDQSAPKRFRQMEYGMAASSGRAMATGPLVMTPKPMAAQARMQWSAGLPPAGAAASGRRDGGLPAGEDAGPPSIAK